MGRIRVFNIVFLAEVFFMVFLHIFAIFWCHFRYHSSILYMLKSMMQNRDPSTIGFGCWSPPGAYAAAPMWVLMFSLAGWPFVAVMGTRPEGRKTGFVQKTCWENLKEPLLSDHRHSCIAVQICFDCYWIATSWPWLIVDWYHPVSMVITTKALEIPSSMNPEMIQMVTIPITWPNSHSNKIGPTMMTTPS